MSRTVEELERTGVIAALEAEEIDGRLTFSEDIWNAFLEKINVLQANHAKSDRPGGLFAPLRREFIAVVGYDVSHSFINSVIKLTSRPLYFSKEQHGWRFVAWILALPMNYIVPLDQCATHYQVKVTAVPAKETTPRQRSAFEIFVDEHAHEIQAPLIEAWKNITSFYNIEVVLASLRRMGLNDAAIAALSKAASQ